MSNKLVRNEQTKLTATFINGGAIALLGIGGLAPLAALVQSDRVSPLVLVFVLGCMATSMGLHSVARRHLQRLEE
nr:amino acid transporter [uncultured Devosia sp.]